MANDWADLEIPDLTKSAHIRRPHDDFWTNFLELSVRNARVTGQGQIAHALYWRNWMTDTNEVPHDPDSAEGMNFAEMADGPFVDMQDDIGIDLYVWPPGG